MAEPDGSSRGTESESTISMEVITQQLLAGQSKSKSEDTVEFNETEHVASDRKNGLMLICRFCKCKVMRSGKGSFVTKEMSLPLMSEKYKIGTKPTVEATSGQWLVKDMFDFENVGFSKDVDGLKYLICADCERGPIGWHTITETDDFYVTCTRVKYGQS